jgi:hypothetical protein
MNVFEVIPTPANARKIKHLSSMMNIHVDSIIMELASLDIFDSKQFYESLQPATAQIAAKKFESVISYAADTNWRSFIFALDQLELNKAMLLTALASEIKPIVFVLPDHKAKSLSALINLFNDCKVDYQLVGDRFSGVNKDVLVVSPADFTSDVIKATRAGLCVACATLDTISNPIDSFFSSQNKKNLKSSRINFKLLGLDYERVLVGIAMDNTTSMYYDDKHGKNKSWSKTREFHGAFTAIFPEHKMEMFFDTYHNGMNETQGSSKFMKNGFVLTSPDHFAPLMNINIDLLK